MNLRYCLLVALFWPVAAAHAQWPHLNRKINSKKTVIRSAIVMPAEVSFTRVGVKGGDGSIPEADAIATSFYSSLVEELSLRGVKVLPNPLNEAKDDAARFAAADLQSIYDREIVYARKKPGSVDKGKIRFGDRVANFKPGAGADVLVFLRGEGKSRSAGKNAINLASAGFLFVGPEFHGEVTFVDAKTGEVLVFFRFNRKRNMTLKADERFSSIFRAWLHDVPLPVPPPKK